MSMEKLLTRYQVQPKGIIHVGGNGDELAEYLECGFKRILFITESYEAFAKIHAAIRASGSQAPFVVRVRLSSVPGYQREGEELMPSRRLDSLLIELRVHPKLFNVLVGVSNPVNVGGKETLKYLDLVDGVYQGRPFLNLWQKPYGRFGNGLFQYFMGHLVAEHHNLRLRTPPWDGQSFFGLFDPLLEREAREHVEHGQDPANSMLWESLTFERRGSIKNVCIAGVYQYHTGVYSSSQRKTFRALFTPVTALSDLFEDRLKAIMGDKKTLVAIHVRRGDYLKYTAEGHSMFYTTPVESYKKWLAEIWPLLDKPMLYVASDDPGCVKEFEDYGAKSAADMAVQMQEQYYVDFWVLTQAHAMAISNSSFSFAAAMLNENIPTFEASIRILNRVPYRPGGEGSGVVDNHCMRPLRDGTLVRFDPWDADVLLGRDEAPPAFPSTEEMCLQLLKNLLLVAAPHGAFIEVGLGTFAWYFPHFRDRKLIVVEPAATGALMKTAAECQADLVMQAMSDVEGLVNFYAGRGDDLNSMLPDWWGRDNLKEPISVPSVRYHNLVANKSISEVACLKLDVEGAEFKIISTFPETQPNLLPKVVMFEYGGTPRRKGQGGWTPEALANTIRCIETLLQCGYTQFTVVENHREPKSLTLKRDSKINVDDWFDFDADYGNIIAVRETSFSQFFENVIQDPKA